MPRQLKPCGTVAAYRRHLKNGEEACRPYKDAAVAASRGPTRVRQRALARLVAAHLGEYSRILAEENAKENP